MGERGEGRGGGERWGEGDGRADVGEGEGGGGRVEGGRGSGVVAAVTDYGVTLHMRVTTQPQTPGPFKPPAQFSHWGRGKTHAHTHTNTETLSQSHSHTHTLSCIHTRHSQRPYITASANPLQGELPDHTT